MDFLQGLKLFYDPKNHRAAYEAVMCDYKTIRSALMELKDKQLAGRDLFVAGQRAFGAYMELLTKEIREVDIPRHIREGTRTFSAM